MKLVIYKDLSGYCVTNEDNYNAPIMNTFQVIKCYDFDSADEIIEYYCKYFNSNLDDFIVIDR